LKEAIWNISDAQEPLIATAIHDGHDVREEVKDLLHLSDDDRLREQDPYTGDLARTAKNHIIPKKSRFEVDLNRPREKAVYVVAEDAWGLKVWKQRPHSELIERSLNQYDDFYTELHRVYDDMCRRFGAFVVFDIHSYNHRRGGPDAEPEHADGHPEVNVGTGTMDRGRWSGVVDRFIRDLSSYKSGGRSLDVRENVKFFGGNHPKWSHQTFPDSACVIAIEFKKFFMDEWTGEVYSSEFNFISEALQSTFDGVNAEIRAISRKTTAGR
jgi:hypothetical protein